MLFGDRIKKLRTDRGITQKELGDIIGTSDRVIGYYEANDRFPKDENVLNAIADYFNVSVDYLLGRTNDKNSNSSTLTEKDEKDIAKTMEQLKTRLEGEEGLMFDGDPLDPATAQLLLEALETQERMVKAINKKYIPKKHRKE